MVEGGPNLNVLENSDLGKVIPRGEGRFPFPSLNLNNLMAGDKIKKGYHFYETNGA